jgi:hypothetical protein
VDLNKIKNSFMSDLGIKRQLGKLLRRNDFFRAANLFQNPDSCPQLGILQADFLNYQQQFS